MVHVEWQRIGGVPMADKIFPIAEDYPRDDNYMCGSVYVSLGGESEKVAQNAEVKKEKEPFESKIEAKGQDSEMKGSTETNVAGLREEDAKRANDPIEETEVVIEKAAEIESSKESPISDENVQREGEHLNAINRKLEKKYRNPQTHRKKELISSH